MSTAVSCTDFTGISTFSDIGFGADFSILKKYYASIVSELRKTETLGRLDEVFQHLIEIVAECSEEGWDGYDARPITEAAYIEAERFIKSLPLTSSIPMPEIIPEPGGEIGFEWYKGKCQVFVASVRGNNEIVYAGLFGTNKTHGSEYFGDYLPSIIIENLKRLYS